MWSIVQVTESGTLALTQQLSELRTNNTGEFPMPKPAVEVKFCAEIVKFDLISIFISIQIQSQNSIELIKLLQY